ncbi:unnamed protein product [Polarella glacialis]|uniref:Uncharacterized protein n=1 Tax=Polarella glacialis TaxID=89957 RepID=A0A813FTI7_POLGL|nr:unnamed protein product [Polarella glacialis]|mmetsp:Transcript_72493/g.116894  ORF Transcript_72493/g.116894 Transcript_72493/m.116894 type:complete len:151 (-) Transcript_72493:263-715(-)
MSTDVPPGGWHLQGESWPHSRGAASRPKQSSSRISTRPEAVSPGSSWDSNWEECYPSWGEHHYDAYGESEDWDESRCRNGTACRFLALGTCQYYHPEEDIATASAGSTSLADRQPGWNVLICKGVATPEKEEKGHENSRSLTTDFLAERL